jgi:polyphosphate kinase 2 (PPK2 family)
MVYENLMVKHGKKITLRTIDPEYTNGFQSKQSAEDDLPQYLQKLMNLQYLLYAGKRHALLVILQGVDAAGKDGVFRHVITALNPQGTKVWSFGKPSPSRFSLGGPTPSAVRSS